MDVTTQELADNTNEACNKSKEDSELICSKCGKKCADTRTLYLHTRCHGEKKHSCSECGKGFTQVCHLKRHQRIHSGIKPYQCPLCLKAFSQLSHLNIHYKSHTGEKQHTCEECNKSFIQKSQLRRHIRSHSSERPYKCTQCGKTYKFSDHLFSHMKYHMDKKLYSCELCSQSFYTNASLKSHKKSHISSEYIQLKCSLCFSRFKSKLEQCRHVCCSEESVTGKFECQMCTKKYTTIKKLQRHGKVHKNYSSLTCMICLKKCETTSHLHDHIKVHLKHMKFQCEICVRSFNLHSSLDLHMAQHAGKKLPYRCLLGECVMEYSTLTDLKNHSSRHFEISGVPVSEKECFVPSISKDNTTAVMLISSSGDHSHINSDIDHETNSVKTGVPLDSVSMIYGSEKTTDSVPVDCSKSQVSSQTDSDTVIDQNEKQENPVRNQSQISLHLQTDKNTVRDQGEKQGISDGNIKQGTILSSKSEVTERDESGNCLEITPSSSTPSVIHIVNLGNKMQIVTCTLSNISKEVKQPLTDI